MLRARRRPAWREPRKRSRSRSSTYLPAGGRRLWSIPPSGRNGASSEDDFIMTPARLEAGVKLEADLGLSERLFAGLMDFSRDAPGVTRAAYGEGEQCARQLMPDA